MFGELLFRILKNHEQFIIIMKSLILPDVSLLYLINQYLINAALFIMLVTEHAQVFESGNGRQINETGKVSSTFQTSLNYEFVGVLNLKYFK